MAIGKVRIESVVEVEVEVFNCSDEDAFLEGVDQEPEKWSDNLIEQAKLTLLSVTLDPVEEEPDDEAPEEDPL